MLTQLQATCLHLGIVAIQIIVTIIVTDKSKLAEVVGLFAVMQGIIGHLGYDVNPDGTKATLPYVPSQKTVPPQQPPSAPLG